MSELPKMEIFMRCSCGACCMLEWPREWTAWYAEARDIAKQWCAAHANCALPPAPFVPSEKARKVLG